MMVTMKLARNVIVCDNKDSVGIINPKTMQKIHSIQLPKEDTYVIAIFMH